MAKLIPANIDSSIANSEIIFLKALFQYTPDNWVVYHNFNFLDFDNAGHPKRAKTLQEGEADVVLFIPEQGFIVVEVKGGGIEYKNNQWYTEDRYGEFHSIKNPFEQARKAEHFISRKCKQETNERFVQGYAVCFPNMKIDMNVDLPLDAPPQVVLTNTSLQSGQLEKNILSLFKHWNKGSSLSLKASKQIQQVVLQPAFRLVPQLSLKHETEKNQLLQLTQQQYQTLDFLINHQHALIEGGAGTGKTLLLMEKARRLAEADKKVLVLTFNLKLAGVIKSSFSSTKLVEVNTIHTISEQLCKKAGLKYKVPDKAKDISDFFNDTSIELLSQANEKLNVSFDAILVDEAQDFEDHWWLAIMELLISEDPKETWLYVFYDKNQNIFKRDYNFPIDYSHTFSLTYNCRNTSQISHWLNQHFSYSSIANPLAPGGDTVEMIRWKNKDDQNLKLIHQIEQMEKQGVDLDEIVILTAFKPENSLITKPKNIEFTTIMKYKGLEKSVVILVDVQPDMEYSIREDLIYTAASRAVSKLILLVKKGELPEYLKT